MTSTFLDQEKTMSLTHTTKSGAMFPAPTESDPAAAKRAGRLVCQRGMTLIEIMVVLVILGMIAAAVAVNVVGSLKDARMKQANTDVRTLSDCIDLYQIDKGQYPSTEEGLQAVVAAGKCKPGLKDPWGRDYVYLYPGQVHPDSYDVKSYGADGAPGGDGENADIVNP